MRSFRALPAVGLALLTLFVVVVAGCDYGTSAVLHLPPVTVPTVPPVPTDFPDATTTGVPAGVSLAQYKGPNPITADGTVVDGQDLGAGTTLFVDASNVVIRNSHMGTIYLQKGTNLQVSYSTIDGAASGCNGNDAVQYGDYSLDHVKVINFSDGPRVSGSNISITNSYILACYNVGDHADGIQGYGGGTNVVIDHNTIDSTAEKSANSAIFFADGSKGATITNNYLAGGQYVLQPLTSPNGAGKYVVSGNVIGNNSWDYGPCNVTNSADETWSGNELSSGTALPSNNCA